MRVGTTGTSDSRRLTSEEFREVIGHFASGVTVVTVSVDGRPYGTTASAVTSLALEPPMLLVCMNRESETGRAMASAGSFAVNILGEDHEELSNLFAKKGADRFSATPWRVGVSGAPVLEEAIAYLDCNFEAEYPGGDHKIIVGRVLDLDMREGALPLLFYQGGYSRMHDA